MCIEEGRIILEVKDLEVVYRTEESLVRAVNGISFSVRKRETVGLVGETGAGKTTTALSILRLLPERTGFITNGEILFKGENLLTKSAEEMRLVRGAQVSMIFQDPMTALNPILTVGEQIMESLEIHNYENKSTNELRRRVPELLNLVGIASHRQHDYPHQFSGGMRQRVVIAIALACEPSLLIADEPTTALDVTIQAQVLALIHELQEKLGTAMIMISHDLGVIAQTCQKVGVMYAGEIVEFGTAEDIFNGDCHHPYTIGLFNAIPDLTDDVERLKPIDGLMPDPSNLSEGCKFHPRCPMADVRCRTGTPYRYEQDDHVIHCNLFM
jgi:peptide/nickel transport system ATP-binding protein